MSGSAGTIRIRGARVHNLQNLDVDLPRNRLVAITGPSGSGKSSLAFDTLFAEGQRRYVESLSAYARQFLQRLAKPEVESIEGLSPAIAIEQRTITSNPRSTVGTVTEVNDYLRLLFARTGRAHCPGCARPLEALSPQQMQQRILQLVPGTRLALLAAVRPAPGEDAAGLRRRLLRQGFTRARAGTQLLDLEDEPAPEDEVAGPLEVFVDRLVVRPDIASRLADSLEVALRLGGGRVLVSVVDGDDLQLSERLACPECELELPPLEPRLFSFNSPQGACPRCDGLGMLRQVDEALLVGDVGLSLSQGVLNEGKPPSPYQLQTLQVLARELEFSLDTPWAELPQWVRRLVLHGSGERQFDFRLERQGMRHDFRRPYEGVIPQLERRYRQTNSEAVRRDIERLMSARPCPECGGSRLRREALAVRVGGQTLADWSRLPVSELRRLLDELRLEPAAARVAAPILRELVQRLDFMLDVGLGYLALERPTATLSGGEAQRIRLASQLGAALAGVLYVLDEPTIGLHPRDCRRLLDTLLRLRDLGNTVVVVEHDPATIRAADHVVDMGPGAGWQGGQVVAAGTPARIMRSRRSLTGAYLSGRRRIEVPRRRRRARGWLKLAGARGRNLAGLTVRWPLGVFTCVTGVSGSGKSTLVVDTLYRALARRLHRAGQPALAHDRLQGLEALDKVVHVDQSPIGRTPRSNPATYTGLFEPVRRLFASLPESRVRGWGPGRFSFNTKGGRCEACQGAGQVRIEMHFLPDMFVTCEVCGGRRFNTETLQARFRGHDISRVLELTVDQARELFAHQRAIASRLETLAQVGLGYLHLGQNATTLSGGEAQRVKLARELARPGSGRTLYILDEPTTGLHFEDIRQLLQVLDRLVERGNSVVVIEHNLEVIKFADHLIDLGPEGGAGGGRLVAQGTPEQVAAATGSHTGRFLRQVLEG